MLQLTGRELYISTYSHDELLNLFVVGHLFLHSPPFPSDVTYLYSYSQTKQDIIPYNTNCSSFVLCSCVYDYFVTFLKIVFSCRSSLSLVTRLPFKVGSQTSPCIPTKRTNHIFKVYPLPLQPFREPLTDQRSTPQTVSMGPINLCTVLGFVV